MKEKENILKIIDDFIKNATADELEELRGLLKKRKKTGINIDFTGMARDTAETIQKQMRLTNETVKATARDLVARLARSYNPEFSEKEIRAIVDEMVPSAGPKKKVPPALMIAMVEQFISYSTGAMSEREMKEFPSGWQKKYWEAFPQSLQRLIADLLYDKIDEREFWIAARRLIETGV
jgi:hypothetical protein